MNMRTVDTLFLACRSTLVLAKLLSDTMFGWYLRHSLFTLSEGGEGKRLSECYIIFGEEGLQNCYITL